MRVPVMLLLCSLALCKLARGAGIVDGKGMKPLKRMRVEATAPDPVLPAASRS